MIQFLGGNLSDRMTTSNNIWIDTWNNAMARPVIHQDRLFNEVKEAEQILHYFAHIKVQDLIQLILPVIFTTSVRKLLEEGNYYSQRRLSTIYTGRVPRNFNAFSVEFSARKNLRLYIYCSPRKTQSFFYRGKL